MWQTKGYDIHNGLRILTTIFVLLSNGVYRACYGSSLGLAKLSQQTQPTRAVSAQVRYGFNSVYLHESNAWAYLIRVSLACAPPIVFESMPATVL